MSIHPLLLSCVLIATVGLTGCQTPHDSPVPCGNSTTVSPGDSVYGIARRCGVPPRELIEVNRLQPPYTLHIGTVLNLPNRQAPRVVAQKRETKGEVVAAPRETVQVSTLSPPAPPAPPPASSSSSTADRLASLETLPPLAGKGFLWPVRGKVITEYGRIAKGQANDGINIAAPVGTPVKASENGVVAYVGNELKGFGNLVLVKHAEGWVTAYAHADKVTVRTGDHVQKGQTIATVGKTGLVSSSQLHFEIRKGTQAVNPHDYLRGSGTV